MNYVQLRQMPVESDEMSYETKDLRSKSLLFSDAVEDRHDPQRQLAFLSRPAQNLEARAFRPRNEMLFCYEIQETISGKFLVVIGEV